MSTTPKPIKFIYFDVGGVVILDYSKTNKWNEMMNDLGIAEKMEPLFMQLFEGHKNKITIGEDTDVFVKEAREKLGINFPSNYSMTQDFVNRFAANPSMSELIKRLKTNYKVGLLTDQYPGMLEMIFQRGLTQKDRWDVIIDSSVEKVSKHSPEIFVLAEKRAAVEPESILFVENSPKHIELAKTRNWITFEYDPAQPEDSTRELELFIKNYQ